MTPARILVAGAGPVGLVCAIALKRRGHEPLVVEARDRGAAAGDTRAVALSHGSRLILERLDVWRAVTATPIRHIEVSQQNGFGRARIAAADHGIDALGHVARLGGLIASLERCAESLGVEMRFNCALGPDAARSGGAAAVPDALGADLLVRAEGTPGALAAVKDYRQTAIVTEAETRGPHDFRAWERFTREGPLALLPLDAGYSVVWCMAPERAALTSALPVDQFIAELGRATHFAPYEWTAALPPRRYPLALMRRADAGGAREVWLGNAAQALHPVAGQGLNLGLRDAFELSLALTDGVSNRAIASWRRARRTDRNATVAATDRYVSLFSNDFAPLRVVRGLGLAMVDLVPPLRGFVARRMMFGLR